MLIDVSTMTPPDRLNLVTVGHFAIDTISSPKITHARTRLGGSATYVSVAAAKLSAKVSVISKVGDDFPNKYIKWLEDSHVDLAGLKQVEGYATTRFALEYQRDWKRNLQLKALAPPIQVNDIPNSLLAKAIHVAPIANELSIKAIEKLRKLTRVLSLDPQGFIRNFDIHGNVHPKRWMERSVLELIDIYKSSQHEMKTVTSIADVKQAARKIQDYGARIVIVTRGLHGSMVLFESAFCNVPACRPQVVLDPTGAGDAYIGAFLAEYIRKEEPLWCACVGSAAASFIVEGVGPQRFGNREETYARARKVYLKLV